MEIYGYEFVFKTCDISGNHSWFWVLCFLFVIDLGFFSSGFLMNMYEDEGEDEGRRWRNEEKVGYWWYTLRYNKPSRSNNHFLIKKDIEWLKLKKLTRFRVDQHCFYST